MPLALAACLLRQQHEHEGPTHRRTSMLLLGCVD
jgi:hypothetical protein